MDNDTSDLLEIARRMATNVTRLAGELLMGGADAKRVHRDYSVAALDLLSDAEAQGVLSATGDQRALATIEDIVQQLLRLWVSARRERDSYTDGPD